MNAALMLMVHISSSSESGAWSGVVNRSRAGFGNRKVSYSCSTGGLRSSRRGNSLSMDSSGRPVLVSVCAKNVWLTNQSHSGATPRRKPVSRDTGTL